MCYGKSAAQEIDQAIRRKPSQKLKSAAPGAPFGWCADGTPYVGTQYCIKASNSGLKFASLSTRNGSAQCMLVPPPLSHACPRTQPTVPPRPSATDYWKDLSGLSSKVALSALETHGRVDALLANESTLPIGEVLETSKLEAVRAVFRRLVGAQTLEKMEATVDDAEEKAAGGSSSLSVATPVGEGIGVKVESMEGSKVVGKKRLARMEAADEIHQAMHAVSKAKKEKRDLHVD